ncbi:MAG: hypothetical protein JXA73_20005 [Acidobacteria bacterium]|nr:hypothetical protein [Acidobacteriota bacterium]
MDVSGSSRVYAIVRVPQTDVTISGDSQLSGALVCDSLRLSGNALLRIAMDNQPPDVSAGSDQSITLPQDTVELNGTAADDGLPADVLSVSWSRVSGPGSVLFSDANSSVTTATFSSAGLYVLRLTASDGQLTGSSDVTVTVIPQNLPPFADAGPDQTVTLPETAVLNGVASDDGQPAGTLMVSWSKVAGPGTVVFSDPASAVTEASFSVAGEYVLRLTVGDSVLFSSDDVTVTVKPENLAPIVHAGSNQTITLPAQAQLIGQASDDGLPEGSSLVVTWNQIEGPGVAVFADIHSAATTVSFSITGVYVFQLLATDGTLTASSTVSITVNPESGQTLPPDPATVAPPLDPTIATTMEDAVKFLYTGANPIQRGVESGVMNPIRLAVVKGKVFDRAGDPLPGVNVTILNHPEFGYTLSRLDGGYDMAVNGGGLLMVNFEKEGYLPAQRPANTPWQDYVLIEEIRMVTLDTEVTAVDLSATDIQVARSSVVTDEDGTRQVTMLFAPGTTATMQLPDGTTQDLSMMHVRATEYTVGPNGPEAMPAPLPPQSAYTYAAEFSVDEALAAGAVRVQFNQTIVTYVDNFLNFPAGTIVPVGYYDRMQGLWIATDSGRVIKIMGNVNGLAEVDTDGDNVGDNDPALGITDVERSQMAALYAENQSLWRVQIKHFTPFDLNWSSVLPADAVSPEQPAPELNKPKEPDCTGEGSIIECQSQILGESIGVAGTPFSLNYRSDRAPGNRAEMVAKISVSGDSVPATLVRIEVNARIAGRQLSWNMEPLPNQFVDFAWDGTDVYGRPTTGWHSLDIDIGYVYSSNYANTMRFGAPPVGSLMTLARDEIVIHQKFSESIRGALVSINEIQALGGWTLDAHHSYDPIGQILLYGDGSRKSSHNLNNGIITAAGGGNPPDGLGDGGLATQATLSGNIPIPVVAPDGSLYIRDNFRIRKVDPDGIIRTVAGNGGFCDLDESSCGEGGPAINAHINAQSLDMGTDGSLYIKTYGDWRILKIGPDGIIHTLAGDGTSCVYSGTNNCGDNGPARLARFSNSYPDKGIALGPDGGIYIADTGNHRIRRIGPDGIISTVAGTGVSGFSGDGGPATQASFSWPTGIAAGLDGSLYISDSFRVRRIWPDGIIRTIAGIGARCDAKTSPCGDGGPALEAKISPRSIAIARDGSLLVVDGSYADRIRRIGSDGIIRTIAGGGNQAFKEGIPANQFSLYLPRQVAVAPDGSFYIDYNGSPIRVLHVLNPLPEMSTENIAISSDDGAEIYEFDSRGRHQRTLNALTSAVLYEFAYTANGRLASITDGDGNTTIIERDGEGKPLAIIGPFGQRTELTLDPNGYLASVTDPENQAIRMTYTADGLLKTFKDANNHESSMSYDALGRLIKDENATHGFQQLQKTRTGSEETVTVSTAMGRQTVYKVTAQFQGASAREYTFPDGTKTTHVLGADSSSTTITADGVESFVLQGPDPRFGMQSPIPITSRTKMPSGLTRTQSATRTAVRQDPNDPQSLRLTDTVNVNGRPFKSVYDMPTRTFTDTTPVGRWDTSVIDGQGRVLNSQTAGLEPVSNSYDARGRLESSTRGTGTDQRLTTFTYNANGYLETATDALNRTVSFQYDAAGRVVSQQLPDSRVISYTYDAAGNLKSLTPPSRPAHGFDYTPVDLMSAYTPPDVGAGANLTTYEYNLDKQPTLITRPDGQTVSFGYDDGGRQSAITTPDGQYGYGYDLAGRVSGISAPNGPALTYMYDGSLPLSESWSGAINGSVSRAFNNNFWVTSQSINGSNTVSFNYDNDGLLIGAGGMTLARDPQNGLLTGTALGQISDSWSYNGFGEPATYNAAVNGNAVFAVTYTRDKLGRITDKSETMSGSTVAYHYDYSDAGRLTDVLLDGIPASHYEYDGNGNRTMAEYSGASYSGTYDNQDRMLAYGPNTYSYTANGELLTKTTPSGTASYSYDVLGNLRSVTLPDGTSIEYVIDGQNRRVGKKVNGTLAQGFLYDGQLQIAAELDVSGNVISRFVYADRGNVPSYMVKAGITYRIFSDHLGSPRLIINTADGTIAQRMDYDEFGNVTTDTNPGFQPFGFAGGVYDHHTGLIRFGARDYDPQSGRWMAKDPILFSGGDTNLYGYVFSDPVNLTDANGLDWLQNASNFFAGMGDSITFGGTDWVRNSLGIGGAVDPCSSWYNAGGIAGDAWWAAFSSAIMARIMGSIRAAAGADDAAKYSDYWRRQINNAAPERSAPYSIRRTFDPSGNLKSATTYDRIGNRAYQYEFGPGTRHSEGYHVFDNSGMNSALGKGPRSGHIPF